VTVEAVIACCCAQDECCAATSVAISTSEFSILFRSQDAPPQGFLYFTTIGAFGTVEQSIQLNPAILNGAGLARFNAQQVPPFCRYQNQTPTSGYTQGTPFLNGGRIRIAGGFNNFQHSEYIVYRYAEPFRFFGFNQTRYEAGWLIVLRDPAQGFLFQTVNLIVAQIGDVGPGSCPFTAYDFGDQTSAETQYRGVPRIHSFSQTTGTQNLADPSTSNAPIHFAYDAAGTISVS
jgi:hypothetical protein